MRKLMLCLAMVLCPLGAQASVIERTLPGAELRGTATFRFIGLKVYDARLYTQGGAALDWRTDFGIELTYKRTLTQFDIVESTMRELGRTGTALPVRAKLEACFDDVRSGDRYLAISDGPNRVGFWRNDRKACTVEHPQFKARFMGIFLGDNTQSKSFTRALKGN